MSNPQVELHISGYGVITLELDAVKAPKSTANFLSYVNSGHYNGQTGGAKSGLVVLNAMTGTLLRSIPLPATFSAGRGLGGVTLERDARRRIVRCTSVPLGRTVTVALPRRSKPLDLNSI